LIWNTSLSFARWVRLDQERRCHLCNGDDGRVHLGMKMDRSGADNVSPVVPYPNLFFLYSIWIGVNNTRMQMWMRFFFPMSEMVRRLSGITRSEMVLINQVICACVAIIWSSRFNLVTCQWQAVDNNIALRSTLWSSDRHN
jgi:hypothetical protein